VYVLFSVLDLNYLLVSWQNMDMSNPAAFVNAELLHFYVGRRVRALMQVVRSDGGVVIGKSTDEKQVVVKGAPPAPLTTFLPIPQVDF